MSRAARFPFSFGQRVSHSALPISFVVITQECDRLGDWTISVTDENGGGWWRFPAYELAYASLADEQKEMAKWLGCPVARMNAHHDRLHEWLSARAGLQSMSLAQSRNEPLTPEQNAVAAAEEDAVLYIQRYICTVENMLSPAQLHPAGE